MASDAGTSSDQIRQIFGAESGRGVIERSLLTRRAYDRLAEIAEGKPVPAKPAAKPSSPREAPQAAAVLGPDPVLLGQYGEWGAYGAQSSGGNQYSRKFRSGRFN